jgi:hypothetical protein
MVLLWLLTGAALITAALAWRTAIKTARRLDQLSQMFWALKYQQGELRGHLQHPPSGGQTDPDARSSDAASPPRPADAFVPLSSLKR